MPTKEEKLIFNHTIDGEAVDTSKVRNLSTSNKEGKAAHTVSSRKKPPKKFARHDPYIWGIYITILIISIVELFSASSSEIHGSNVYKPLISHCLHLAIGLGIILWIQNVHYGYFARFAWICAVASLLLLIYSSFFGAQINGAQRAINLPGFTLQPAEMVKLTVVVLLATILGRSQRPGGVSTSGVIYVAVIVVIFSGILWINGLTNTVLLMGVSLSMFLIGGIQWKKLGIVLIVYGCCAGMIWMIKESRDKTTQFEMVAAGNGEGAVTAETNSSGSLGRTETHGNRFKEYMRGVRPTDTINDKNRQVFYAKLAQANGGLIGRGPGNSRESARLPLAFSDYIYSIVVEDIGFLGGLGLLILYLCLLARAGRIAYKCRRAFPAFLIMGCAVLIVFQALVHMAIVTGVAPVSGQPLPLISKGGTSVLVMSTAIGIMLSVSRFAVKTDDRKENREEANILPDELLAKNVSTIE